MDNNENCFLCKHPMIKCVLVGLLIFLGAFAAFYVVSDWHFKRMLDPMYQMKSFDRAMIRQERNFNKMAKKEMLHNGIQFIHVEKIPNAYKFIIDLRPFDNNEKNIDVKFDGNTLIINASGEKNSKRKQEIVNYSQTFSFAEKINADEITKVREADRYIITVPFD
jgi:HSP20 family molecular chaperone IbpA